MNVGKCDGQDEDMGRRDGQKEDSGRMMARTRIWVGVMA